MGRAFGKTGLARGGRFFAWVLDGASPAERAGVTASVPATGPHDHRRDLRPELPQGRRAHLVDADRPALRRSPRERSLPSTLNL